MIKPNNVLTENTAVKKSYITHTVTVVDKNMSVILVVEQTKKQIG